MSTQETEKPQKTFKDRLHAVDEWFQNHKAACIGLMPAGGALAFGTNAVALSFSSPVAGGVTACVGMATGVSAFTYGLWTGGKETKNEPITYRMQSALLGIVVSFVWGGITARNIGLEQERQDLLETTPSITDVANDTERREAFLNAFHQAHNGTYPATAEYTTENGKQKKVRIPAPTPQ